jgi:Ca-activated chloride channel homolog
MRRTFSVVTAALIAVVTSGCSSSATLGPVGQADDHRQRTTPPVVEPYRTQPPVGAYPTAAPAAAGATAAPARVYPAATSGLAQSTTAPEGARPTPYDGVTFEDPGVNPYVDTTQDNHSTFALDVDTASYTIARRFILDGQLPDPASVRVEEWVNYFDQGYAPPETGAFAIHADGGPTPVLSPSEVLLRVGIKAAELSNHERPAAALTFVIDTSGSMGRDNRLDLVKQALGILVRELRNDDTVAIVAFSTEARVVLQPTWGADQETILRAIDMLQPQDSTNVGAGLTLGYDLARHQLLEGGINRVVLASDGVANEGNVNPDAILEAVRSDTELGIQLVSVGVGMGNYNDALLERLADQGDGFYAYVDTLEEASRLFREDLVSTLDTIALDAKVQIEFDPGVVAAYRLIGFENRAVADQDFRNNDVAAGAIGAGHAVTALYGLRLRDGIAPNDRIGTVSLRWTDPQSRRAAEIARDVNGEDLGSSFGWTDEHFKLDSLVAATAEVLRGSPWIEGYGIEDLASAAREISSTLPRTDQVSEFLDLLEQAARFRD